MSEFTSNQNKLKSLRIRSSNKFGWLENLEREIYLDNLDEDEIKEKLEREYIGVNVFKLISKREEKRNTVATELFNLLKEGNSKMEDLKKIDVPSQFEMINNVKKKFEEYKSVCNETILQLTEIERQGFLDKDEQIKIETVTKEWNNQLKDIERQYKEFCNCCQQVCS